MFTVRVCFAFFAGVEKVTIDTDKDQITVKGTMDVNALAPYLTGKLKRTVELLPSKKNGGGESKKEKGGGDGKKEKGGGSDKKDKAEEKGGGGGDSSGDGEKKKKKNKDGNGGGEVVKMMEMNKMEHYGGGGYLPYGGYQYEIVHAPQIFSDENPNACSIM